MIGNHQNYAVEDLTKEVAKIHRYTAIIFRYFPSERDGRRMSVSERADLFGVNGWPYGLISEEKALLIGLTRCLSDLDHKTGLV